MTEKALEIFIHKFAEFVVCHFAVQQIGFKGTWPTLIFEPNRKTLLLQLYRRTVNYC